MDVEYRQQITFVGMLIGAVLGALGAQMWLDRQSDNENADAVNLGYGDLARIGAATFALVRQINDMNKKA
ncbi:MAG: hypothetical protein KDD73_13050 [Anaerolineales bacterium]|nr:hypothetical protein [Anaerolineales bacterium]MCB9128768.1 hypothetical protein [Ardenticatenales bacterium]